MCRYSRSFDVHASSMQKLLSGTCTCTCDEAVLFVLCTCTCTCTFVDKGSTDIAAAGQVWLCKACRVCREVRKVQMGAWVRVGYLGVSTWIGIISRLLLQEIANRPSRCMPFACLPVPRIYTHAFMCPPAWGPVFGRFDLALHMHCAPC